MKTYYTLAVRDGGKWAAQFGDYDREVVDQEREDAYLSNPYKPADLRILRTAPDQMAIDLAINELNKWRA